MDVLMAEALRAGPIVVIIWLLLQRLERRFGAFEERMGTRVSALETKLADGTMAQRLATLEARALEDRQVAQKDRDACIGKLATVERELLGVWRKVGDRPEDKAAG